MITRVVLNMFGEPEEDWRYGDSWGGGGDGSGSGFGNAFARGGGGTNFGRDSEARSANFTYPPDEPLREEV